MQAHVGDALAYAAPSERLERPLDNAEQSLHRLLEVLHAALREQESPAGRKGDIGAADLQRLTSIAAAVLQRSAGARPSQAAI